MGVTGCDGEGVRLCVDVCVFVCAMRVCIIHEYMHIYVCIHVFVQRGRARGCKFFAYTQKSLTNPQKSPIKMHREGKADAVTLLRVCSRLHCYYVL